MTEKCKHFNAFEKRSELDSKENFTWAICDRHDSRLIIKVIKFARSHFESRQDKLQKELELLKLMNCKICNSTPTSTELDAT